MKGEGVQPCQPGRFFKRELPCLLAALDAVVMDGYVTLDEMGKAGLGQHLFDVLDGKIPVVGVAKTAFQESAHALKVLWGGSQTPLYVTAAGMQVQDAAQHVRNMHVLHWNPTLLKRVDRLCRNPTF